MVIFNSYVKLPEGSFNSQRKTILPTNDLFPSEIWKLFTEPVAGGPEIVLVGISIPVVPHKAVAEVSNIGNL